MADDLLQEHAALAAADKAIEQAQHMRAVAWARERDARAALTSQMAVEGLKRIDRPTGSIREIGARMRTEENGEHKVLSFGCLRVLPRRPPTDPLFVFRQAERALALEDDAPVSEQRRRVG